MRKRDAKAFYTELMQKHGNKKLNVVKLLGKSLAERLDQLVEGKSFSAIDFEAEKSRIPQP